MQYLQYVLAYVRTYILGAVSGVDGNLVEMVLRRRSVLYTARAARGGDEIDAVWLHGGRLLVAFGA